MGSALQKTTWDIRPESKSQYTVMNDFMSPNLFYWGPWGTGKTHIASNKALFVANHWPNSRIALIRRKRVDLKATLWRYFVEKCLPPQWVVRHNDTDLMRRIANGSEVMGFGLDSVNDVNKLASNEFNFIVVEEAREITAGIFEEKILRNMRLPGFPFHQVLLLSNPDSPAHWLHERFFSRRDQYPGYHEIRGHILRHILPKSYLTRMDGLTGVYRLRYRDGLWVAAEGQVYPYDPGKNHIKRIEIPKDWRREVGIDFGYDHPFVCQWWAISPEDKWFMYREIYMTNRTVNKHAPQIVKYNEEDGIDPVIICDHDAGSVAILHEYGIRTMNAKKDRLKGQNSVARKFENDQVFFFDDALVEKDDRLVINQKPMRTVEEFGGLVWDGKTKEDWGKENDDGTDTMRYVIHTKSAVGAAKQHTGRY